MVILSSFFTHGGIKQASTAPAELSVALSRSREVSGSSPVMSLSTGLHAAATYASKKLLWLDGLAARWRKV